MACINRNKLRSRGKGMMSMPTIKAWLEDGHGVCKSRPEWRANKISITCKSARPPYKALCKSTSHLRVVKFCAARYQLASLFYFALCRKQSSQKSESQKKTFRCAGRSFNWFCVETSFWHRKWVCDRDGRRGCDDASQKNLKNRNERLDI